MCVCVCVCHVADVFSRYNVIKLKDEFTKQQFLAQLGNLRVIQETL